MITVNVGQPDQNPKFGKPSGEVAPMEKKTDMEEMVRACCALTEAAWRSPDESAKATWFGAAGRPNKDDINDRAHKVFDFLSKDSPKREVLFVCMKVPGSIASYAQYGPEKVKGGQPLEKCKTSMKVVLGDGFRDVKYSWGEKVRSVLHEFTHAVIGTEDVGPDEDHKVYGSQKCLALAKGEPDNAYKNADNWAYYLASYYPKTYFANKKWS